MQDNALTIQQNFTLQLFNLFYLKHTYIKIFDVGFVCARLTNNLARLKRQAQALRKESTQSITYRLPQKLLGELENEAEQKGISQNVLVRQILAKYVRWDRFAGRMDMVPVPKVIMDSLCKGMDDHDIDKMVNDVLPVIVSSVMFIKGGYDLNRCIETLEDYMKSSGVKSDHRVDGNVHSFIIQHELGMNWSVFTERVLSQMFRSFVPEKDLKFQTTESTVILSVSLGADFNEHEY